MTLICANSHYVGLNLILTICDKVGGFNSEAKGYDLILLGSIQRQEGYNLTLLGSIQRQEGYRLTLLGSIQRQKGYNLMLLYSAHRLKRYLKACLASR